MKKFLLTLGLALAFNFTFAQKRSIDWSVEAILAPTSMASTAGGTSFQFEAVVKNNGTDTVLATDTVLFQILITEGSTGILAYPGPSSLAIKLLTRNIVPGDTMHISGALSTTYKTPLSRNVQFTFNSFAWNRASNGIFPETSTTNNTKTANIVWTNQYGWGVSVNTIKVDELSMYPNPATDEVIISTGLVDASAGGEITITDMTGRIVYHELVDMSTAGIVVKVSDMTAGIYNVNIKNGKLNTYGKLIVR